jgi:hypothetical protein
LVSSSFTSLASERQFEFVRCPLPSSIDVYFRGRYAAQGVNEYTSKELERLSHVKAIFQNSQNARYVRSVRIASIELCDVPEEVLHMFAKLLIRAHRLQQLWIELPRNVPLSVLQQLRQLQVLRLSAAVVENLHGLPISTLVVDCEAGGSHFSIPYLPKLQSLCIVSRDNASLPLLNGSALECLRTLSLRGTFGALRLSGTWDNVRVLNLVGEFTDLSWLPKVAPHLKHLSLCLMPYGEQFDDELLALNFGKLTILELHWCALSRFPRNAHLPQLKFYSESRHLLKGERGDLNLLRTVEAHLQKIKVLALCAQYDWGLEKSHTASSVYDKLHDLRKQGQLRGCLIQAPITPPNKTPSWLHVVQQWSDTDMINLRDDDPPKRAFEQHKTRISLLQKVDPTKKFLETQGEVYCTPFTPRPPRNFCVSFDTAWSSTFPFAAGDPPFR